MKKSHLLVAVCTMFFLSDVVVAAPITFDNQTDTIPSGLWTGSFTTQNFIITETIGSLQNHQFITIGGGPSSSTCSPACPYNSTNYLLNKDEGGSIIFTESTGAAFTLFSFDAAESHLDRETQWAITIQVIGTTASSGTVIANFSLDFINDGEGPLVDFQPFVLPSSFTNLVSVAFFGVGGSTRNDFSIDNIDFDLATPEVIPATPITIDIKPSKKPGNIIDLKKDKNLKVAIVGDVAFDALQVDPTTVAFGPGGASPVRFKAQDYNRDGFPDLLLTFKLIDTAISCADVSATLTGETSDGETIEGSDIFTVQPCP